MFGKSYTPMASATIGRHETTTWKTGTGDTHTKDRIHVGQPDLQNRWQRVDASECGNDPCNVPRTFVAMGTERYTYFPEAFRLQSQTFCLTQLEHQTQPSQQVSEWMRKIRRLPEMYMEDFIRVHAFDMNTTVQIADDDFPTFTPDITGPVTNITGQLTTIDLGATANLPQSRLTWEYLNYLMVGLDLDGYHEAPSQLPAELFNLITDKRSWFHLTNGRPELKNMMALTNFQQASPLYKIGQGVQQPYGNFAPTLDTRQIRFQHMGNGMLNRVDQYINTPTTTGIKPVKNPAWINARYGLSWIWHPIAIKMHMPEFGKLRNDLIPSVNNAFYGKWKFVNDNVLMAEQPDGTICTLNNDLHEYFYWVVAMRAAFEFQYPELLYPILHLLDGSGSDGMVNDPVCGEAPQYTAQSYNNDPPVCAE